MFYTSLHTQRLLGPLLRLTLLCIVMITYSRALQWNTEGSKQALEVLLKEAEFDFLLIQEPWINPTTGSTYCSRSSKYYLIHKLKGKAAIFVKKGYPIGQ